VVEGNSQTAGAVIVGAGLAGSATALALRRAGYSRPVTLVGDESHLPYDRPPLSKQILSGEWAIERAYLHTNDEYRDLDISLMLGTPATGVQEGALLLADSRRLEYQDLVVATGVHPVQLREQPQSPRVRMLRTLDDCASIRDDFARIASIIVIGAGFIGAEVASVAHDSGIRVTVIEALSGPFERIVGSQLSSRCARLHRDTGVALRCNSGVERMLETGEGVTVRLVDGSDLTADLVLVAIGVRPTTEWLEGSGLPLDGGIVCDARGRIAGRRSMHALGDVASWQSLHFGGRFRDEHWTSATSQAAIVAQDIVDCRIEPPNLIPYFWSNQHGTRIQMVGRRLRLRARSCTEMMTAGCSSPHILGAPRSSPPPR
jgi:3-phenylpropionate/trans-cinnamate dioxygenase ferredoxin reductase subunit